MQIAKMLTVDKVLTIKSYHAKQSGKVLPDKPYQWSAKSIAGILERPEYTGCTVNFKTYSKSHKLKKRLQNASENYRIFPIHNLRLLRKKCLREYRNYGQTNAAQQRQGDRVYSPAYSIVLTVGKSCTSAQQTVSRRNKSIMSAPTIRAIRVLVLPISSEKKP